MKSFDTGLVLNSSSDSHHDPNTKGKLVCQTFFGLGEVVDTRRDTNGTITLRHKESTDGNDGDVNSNLDSMEPAVGNAVLCIYGRGRVLEVYPEKHQVAVRLSSWRLAKASWVTCYLSTEAVQVVAHDPATKGKLVCQTFFGLGELVETRRDSDGTITLRHKESTDVDDDVNSDLGSVLEQPDVGNVVLCMYGRGRILEVRPEKQQVAVRLSSWRLAEGSSSWVTCYLLTSAVQVVGDGKVSEMTAASTEEAPPLSAVAVAAA
jgi:hypothetical protein